MNAVRSKTPPARRIAARNAENTRAPSLIFAKRERDRDAVFVSSFAFAFLFRRQSEARVGFSFRVASRSSRRRAFSSSSRSRVVVSVVELPDPPDPTQRSSSDAPSRAADANASSSKSAVARSSAANAARVSAFSSKLFCDFSRSSTSSKRGCARPNTLDDASVSIARAVLDEASRVSKRASSYERREKSRKSRRSGEVPSNVSNVSRFPAVSDAPVSPVSSTELRVVCALLALRQSSSESDASRASPSSSAFRASALAVRGNTPRDRPRANDARRLGGARTSAASATASAKGEALEGGGRRAHRRHSARSPRRDTHAPMRAGARGYDATSLPCRGSERLFRRRPRRKRT